MCSRIGPGLGLRLGRWMWLGSGLELWLLRWLGRRLDLRLWSGLGFVLRLGLGLDAEDRIVFSKSFRAVLSLT